MYLCGSPFSTPQGASFTRRAPYQECRSVFANALGVVVSLILDLDFAILSNLASRDIIVTLSTLVCVQSYIALGSPIDNNTSKTNLSREVRNPGLEGKPEALVSGQTSIFVSLGTQPLWDPAEVPSVVE